MDINNLVFTAQCRKASGSYHKKIDTTHNTKTKETNQERWIIQFTNAVYVFDVQYPDFLNDIICIDI